jgi:uncharacterized membrane protein
MASTSSPNPERDEPDLQNRVERLEAAVAELRAEVERLRTETMPSAEAERPAPDEPSSPETGDDASSPAEHPPDRTLGGHAPASEGPNAPSRAGRLLDRLVSGVDLRSEDWLNYVGIGLLLFGLAFLFRYSVEQGWLVPTVRVGFGVALGSVLLGTGLRVYGTRRRLRQVLLGGSSATFYATVFAAYQLYGLVAYPVAFGSMVLITVATIGLAVRQNDPSLAIIGTIGGLGTPFLLSGPAESVGGLAAYTCTVLAGACTIVFVKGWRALLYTTVAGGWLVFLVASVQAGTLGARPPDVWTLQVGIGVGWLLLAGTPVARALYRRKRPGTARGTALRGRIDRLLGEAMPAYGLVLPSPLLGLGASRLLWSPPDAVWATVAGAGALIYAGTTLGLSSSPKQ